MAIINWTSEGMDWGTGVGGFPLKGKMLYPYIEALRLAVVERTSVIQHQTPGGGSGAIMPSLDLLLDPIQDGVLVSNDWGTEFSTSIAYLCHKYIDPTNGLSSNNAFGLKRWNNTASPGFPQTGPTAVQSNAIFTHLGQDIQGNPAFGQISGSLLTAKWARQQYDILNLLIWTMHHDQTGNTQMGNGSPNSNTDEQRAASGATYATAVTNWNATGWFGLGGGIPGFGYHWAQSVNGTNTRLIKRVRLTNAWKCRELPSNTYLPSDIRFTDFKKTWHTIGHLQKPPTSLLTNATINFQDNDYSINENSYNVFLENTTPNYDIETGTVSWGDFPTVTATDPINGEANAWWIDPTEQFNSIDTPLAGELPFGGFTVLKWDQDAVDGFQFVP